MSRSDAAIPTQHSALIMTDPLDHHRTEGAYHALVQGPSDRATACR
jgi:hypothetical protein